MKGLREYSDYVNITRDYLKRYNIFKATIENSREDIDSLAGMLANEAAAPIAKYGDEPGGGTAELNNIEMAAARRMELTQTIASKKRDIARIEFILRRIDRALAVLPAESQALLRGFYLERKDWDELAREHHLSERWARQKGNAALKEVARIMFGEKVIPEQQSLFVFVE